MSFSKRLQWRRLVPSVLLLLVGLPGIACAGITARPPDVPGDHWAAPAIMALMQPQSNAQVSLVEVFGDGTFQGTRTLMRYDFVKNLDNLVLYLASQGVKLGPGGPLPDCPYSDVPAGHYSRDSIRRLLWMIPGSKEMFGGNQPLTRRDMALWLYRLLKGHPKAATVKPAVAPPDSEAYGPMIAWTLAAGEEGLVSGYPDGRFRPDKPLSRYEMAYTMYQVLRWLTESMPAPAEVVQTPPPTTTPVVDQAAPQVRVFEPEVEGSRDFVVVVRKKQLLVVGIAADDTGIAGVTVNGQAATLAFADEADLKKADLKGPAAVWFRAQVPFPAPSGEDDRSRLVIEVTDKAAPKPNKVTRVFVLGSPSPDAPQVVQAAVQPQGTQRVARKWALLVGVNHYDDAENIPALHYSVADVKAVYQALIDPKRGGFSQDTVFLLTDETPDKPSNINIIKYLNRIARRAEPEDLVLVYFSGHGYEEAGRGYILPSNTDIEALAASAVDNSVFIDTLDRMKAQRIVTILDACHSGAMQRTSTSAAALSGSYYKAYGEGTGRVVLASASAGQKAWEDTHLGNGVFTKFVKDGFNGEADKNRDGAVTFMELAKFVYENVRGWAKANGKEQDPMIQAQNFAASDIVLALNPKAIPTGPLAEKKRKVYTLLEPDDAEYACSVLEKQSPNEQEKLTLSWIEQLVSGKKTVDAYLRYVRAVTPK